MPPEASLPPFEQHLRSFLAGRGTDVDAQAVVFNLDRGALEVISVLEGLALRPYNLTHAGFVILMTLWITGSRETRELAAVLRVTKAAVVGAVNTLEARGLLRRVRSGADRRLVTYELTRHGESLVTLAQKEWHELEAAVTSSLTAGEKRTLAALCRKMAHAAVGLRRSRGSQAVSLPDPALFLPAIEKAPTRHRQTPRREKRHAAPSN